MSAGRLIASRLEFKAKMAVASIAISFFVIIIAVAVTQGFRSGISSQIRDFTGDIILRPQWTPSSAGAEQYMLKNPCYLPDILALEEVEGVSATILRAGIVKGRESIYGALFKAICSREDVGVLTGEEIEVIDRVAEEYNSKIRYQGTGCGYCLPCPQKIDIPYLIDKLNNWFAFDKNPSTRIEYRNWTDKHGSDCIHCGQCEEKCPQGLKISHIMREAEAELE